MAFGKDVDAHLLIHLVPDTPHEMPVAELILWSVRARCIRCYAATCRACPLTLEVVPSLALILLMPPLQTLEVALRLVLPCEGRL